MKKLWALTLVVIMSIAMTACGGGKTNQAGLDETVTYKDFEVTVSKDILTADQLNGDVDCYEEFLTTDMTKWGDTVLCDITIVAKDGYTQVVIPYTVKNVGKEKEDFKETITLYYDDEYEFVCDEQYWIMDSNLDNWTKFSSAKLEPLTMLECKAVLSVPEEVFTNEEAPLKLNFAGYEYTIR